MRKIILTLVAVFTAIAGLSAQTPFGHYLSSYNGISYPLSASIENGEKVMYVQVLGSTSDELILFRVRGEESILAFNNALRECQKVYEQRLADKELKKKDYNEILDIVFPLVDICFYRNDVWCFAFEKSLKPELVNSYGTLHFFLSSGAYDKVSKETTSGSLVFKAKRDFKYYFKAIDRNMEKAFSKLAI